MVRKDVSFEDIVKQLKGDLDMNIFRLAFNLKVSDGLIYRRLTEKGYDGITDLKKAICDGELY